MTEKQIEDAWNRSRPPGGKFWRELDLEDSDRIVHMVENLEAAAEELMEFP